MRSGTPELASLTWQSRHSATTGTWPDSSSSRSSRRCWVAAAGQAANSSTRTASSEVLEGGSSTFSARTARRSSAAGAPSSESAVRSVAVRDRCSVSAAGERRACRSACARGPAGTS